MKKNLFVYGIIPFFFLLGLGKGDHQRKPEDPVPEESQLNGETTFSFGLIGDLPYSAKEQEQFPYLIRELNQNSLAFVVHVGDIKGGRSRCDDTVYTQRLLTFQASSQAIILIPGDNDWTDCHRISNGGFDPLERLNYLRKIFFSHQKSLGRNPIPLVRQSQGSSYEEFVENVRWSSGSVLFFGLHVVGSNNNLGRTPQGDAEYMRRNRANLAWMKESFHQAREGEYRGVVMFIHGNPFEPGPETPEVSGFQDFLRDLEKEVRRFGRPVALIHGDTHYFRIDKPLPRSRSKPRLMSFTRVETFGSPNVHWILGRVDLNDPNLFSFEPVPFSQRRQ